MHKEIIKVDVSKVARFGSGLDWIIGLAGGALLIYFLYQLFSTWANGSSFKFNNGLEMLSVVIPMSIGIYFLVGSFFHMPYPFTFSKSPKNQAEVQFIPQDELFVYISKFETKKIPLQQIEGFEVITHSYTYTQPEQIEMTVTDLDRKIAGGPMRVKPASESTLIQYKIVSYPTQQVVFQDMSKRYCTQLCEKLNLACQESNKK